MQIRIAFLFFSGRVLFQARGKIRKKKTFYVGSAPPPFSINFKKIFPTRNRLLVPIDNKINKNLILVFFRFFTHSACLLNTLVSLMSCPLLSIQTFIYILRNNELEIFTQSKFFYSPSILFSSLYLNLCI
jgi:hypothetical protein